MIQSFGDRGTEDLFNGVNSRAARLVCPRSLVAVATRKLDQLDSVESLADLGIPPGNRLEALSAERDGQYSIRVNQQYRLTFAWTPSGPVGVQMEDYH